MGWSGESASVDECCIAAMMGYHKLGAIKQYTVIIFCSRGWNSGMELTRQKSVDCQGRVPSDDSRGNICFLSLTFPASRGCPHSLV